MSWEGALWVLSHIERDLLKGFTTCHIIDGCYVTYRPITLLCMLFKFMKFIYLLSFMCDVCKEVYEHMQ